VDNSRYTSYDVLKRCERKLGIAFREGKELNGWFYLDGNKCKRITIAHGRKAIHPKTYKTMAGQLGLSVEEFDQLLACPLTKSRYELILRDRMASNK
jgi:hypothetical protein